MQQQAEFWRHCLCTLKKQQSLGLLLVVDSQGSSPGKAGAKMAVAADGTRFGTIGGGQVEHDLSEQVMALIQPDSCSRLFRVQHDGAGQVCGGSQTVLYYPCTLADSIIFYEIGIAFQQKQVRQLVFTPEGLALNMPGPEAGKILFSDDAKTGWVYQELIGAQKTAYIIGAGHVCLALSHVLSLLDFEIVVIDQRAELATMNDNTFTRQKIVAPYSEISQHIHSGKHSYVFIMTHSHQTDKQVLAELVNHSFAYLGVLGSQRKIKVMQQHLAGKISKQHWQSIHAPLGLAINSQTPMEIAISIAAELIQEINATENKS